MNIQKKEVKKTYCVAMEPSIHDKMAKEAQDHGISFSLFVRLLYRDYVKNQCNS